MTVADGRRYPRKGGAPRKHRAAHLDDVTYAQALARAAQERKSFSGYVEWLIQRDYGAACGADEEE